ncbi:MAG: cyclic dehypoxanthinyl futalosine synthase [Thermoplasmata archaeon]
MNKIESIMDKALSGTRISSDEAVFLYKDAPLVKLGKIADKLRWKRAPLPIVTFVVDRNINYTNICNVNCKFCAFYRRKNDKDSYVLTIDQILEKVDGLVKIGGTQILLQGGLNDEIYLDYITDTFKTIKERYPTVDIHSLTTTEIDFYARQSGLSTVQVLEKLKNAGMKSLPGGGAEMLVDRIRNFISPKKNTVSSWFKIMDEAQKLGMPTTSTMVFGFTETIEERIEHLSKVRDLQDKNHGFTAFIPWSFEPKNTALSNLKRPSSNDYLRMLAISRIFLDNFRNIESGWVTEGHKIAQIGLHFGANDMGGILMEEHVISAAGKSYHMDIPSMVKTIMDSGYIPAQRDTYYNIKRVFTHVPQVEQRI